MLVENEREKSRKVVVDKNSEALGKVNRVSYLKHN